MKMTVLQRARFQVGDVVFGIWDQSIIQSRIEKVIYKPQYNGKQLTYYCLENCDVDFYADMVAENHEEAARIWDSLKK